MTTALDAAHQWWPALSRPQLLVRLALAGVEAADRRVEEQRARRLAAVRKYGGMLTGVYGPGYLRDIHKDAPA